MTNNACSIEGCERKAWARTWCSSHYQRFRTLGDPHPERPLPGKDPVERFWMKVDQAGSCWMWTGALKENGYGAYRTEWDGTTHRYAHRFSYALAHGPIPAGLQVDHMCSIRACVNPSHLRLVTSKQNHEHLTGQRTNNTSGIRGVSWCKRTKRWATRVQHNYKTYTAGRFSTQEEAEAAVVALRLELFTHNLNDRIETHG